ncbi:hypothetical protein [Roseicella frigidaeris]|uniref:hypothetical protein n=1 Tax=Roseicella frigidaeris TaxID=2230885 RepID=UPI000FDD65FB|nr:hypothetical protein [Roseicella frigidaeris]
MAEWTLRDDNADFYESSVTCPNRSVMRGTGNAGEPESSPEVLAENWFFRIFRAAGRRSGAA